MSLALANLLVPIAASPDHINTEPWDSRMEVSVVFTSVESTIPALKHAATLARRLNARITLLVPQIVPYPLPLTRPPVSRDFNEKRFRVLAANSSIQTRVCLYLCRDPWETLESVLRPHSLVVLGGRNGWWPTLQTKLARRLVRAGHEVIFAEGK